MNPNDQSQLQCWVDTWKNAGPELQRVREAEVRAADTAAALKAFTGLALAAARANPPKPTSGLVEQQRWFRLIAEQQKRARE